MNVLRRSIETTTQSGHLGFPLHGMICSTFQDNYSVDGHLEGPGETGISIHKST